MLREFFMPEEPEESRPIIKQCEDLQDAMNYCTGVLQIVPKHVRYDLATAIAAVARACAFLDNMHDQYMEEYAMTHGPIVRK